MDDFEEQAAREIANIEVRRRQPYTASKIRCSVFNNPLDPQEFEWRMVDVTLDIRREADRLRDMKKKMFETLSDRDIIDNIEQAGNGYFVAHPKGSAIQIHNGGKMGKGQELKAIARMQLSQPQFLSNDNFDKNPTAGPMIDMMIALQWRYDSVFGVVLDDKGHQYTWAWNIDAMLKDLVRMLDD